MEQKKTVRAFNPVGIIRKSIVKILMFTVIFGFPFGYLLSKRSKPRYKAEAMLNITPNLPKILYTVESSQMIKSYEDYLRTQVHVISSYPIVNGAVKSLIQESIPWKKKMNLKIPPLRDSREN